VKRATHLNLVSQLRMCRAIPLLLHMPPRRTRGRGGGAYIVFISPDVTCFGPNIYAWAAFFSFNLQKCPQRFDDLFLTVSAYLNDTKLQKDIFTTLQKKIRNYVLLPSLSESKNKNIQTEGSTFGMSRKTSAKFVTHFICA